MNVRSSAPAKGGRAAAAGVAAGVTLVLMATGVQSASSAATTAKPAEPGTRAAAAARAFDTAPVPRAGVYNVVLAQAPAASYTGGLQSYRRTSPSAGGQLDARAPHVLRYRELLSRRQGALLARIGNPRTLYRYTTALNGFSARLTSAQVLALRKDASVLAVAADRRVKATTVHTPQFLGLTGRRGVWERNGGAARAGAGVVVGVIDTGIWPENPSFKGTADVPRVAGFHGACEAGERFTKQTCNSKVISARFFGRAISSGATIAPADFMSPRDGDGHGSHTASTAAGNHGVDVTIDGQRFGRASGVAPAAKIASYKALWSLSTGEVGTGTDADIVAAIDQAVRDGVDVINFSIGSEEPGEQFTSPTNIAFLNAAAAGIFVASSAGNSGPAAGTVGNVAPWMTTAAASTSFLYQGAVVLGNGRRYVGAMVADRSVSRRSLVLAGDIGAGGVSVDDARLCAPGALDATRATGRIVVCDRGVYDRVAKGLEVRRAGGAGMVLTNVDPAGVDADFHALPTVHLDPPAATAVRAYARTPGARASLDATGRDGTRVPQVASFSSRGPVTSGDGDILKPDIAAPGVSIVAAVAPPSNRGRRWDLYSGTSMASPHVAGLAAFIAGRRPEWSPMAVKSAMMTTAYNLRGSHGPFAQGAGHVNPRRFLDPGLVFDSRGSDWLGFLAGQGVVTGDGTPVSSHPIDGSALNVPSIGIGDLAGQRTIYRRVTNVTDRWERYAVSSSGLPGISVAPRTPTVLVGPHSSRTFAVVFTATGAAQFSRFVSGNVVLRGSRGHVVRLPVSVRALPVAAPAEVTGAGTSGSLTIVGRAGYTGTLAASVAGLTGSTPVAGSLTPGPFDPDNPTADADTYRTTLVVPPGNGAVRFRVDGEQGEDLDLVVYLGGEPVGVSAGGSADEEITGVGVPAGTYDVYVNAFAASGGAATFRYDQWAVPAAPAGNLTVTPPSVPVTVGKAFSLTAAWSGLSPTQNHFGYVTLGDTGRRTFVSVEEVD